MSDKKKEEPRALRDLRCPQDHVLPNMTARGQCTPVYCANEDGAVGMHQPQVGNKKTKHQLKLEAVAKAAIGLAAPTPYIKELLPGEGLAEDAAHGAAAISRADQMTKIGHAAGRLAARRQFAKLPFHLTGVEAENWADKRLVELLPDAVAELQYQLQLGDDGMRERAAARILDANGRGKKDNGNQGGNPIIIIGGVTLPWAQPAKAKAQVVDVTPSKGEGSDGSAK